jgi:hypothetical protein
MKLRSFTPAQLEVLTAPFHAAKEELIKAGAEVSESDRSSAAHLEVRWRRYFHMVELKRAALEA